MPDSILLSTRLHPFPGRHDGPRPWLGFDLERVHDPRRARQAEPKSAASGEMIFQGALWVEKPRAIVDGLHFDAPAAACAIVKPGHQQVTATAAILQNVASELGHYGCDHRHVRGSKRLSEPLAELDIHHGRMQIGISLNIKAAERRPVRVQIRALVQIRVRVGHG